MFVVDEMIMWIWVAAFLVLALLSYACYRKTRRKRVFFYFAALYGLFLWLLPVFL